MQPSMDALIEKGPVDVTAPEHIKVEFDQKRGVLYVHVNGITMFRACRTEAVEIDLALVEPRLVALKVTGSDSA